MPSGCGGGGKVYSDLNLRFIIFHPLFYLTFKFRSNNEVVLCRACLEAGVPERKFIHQLFLRLVVRAFLCLCTREKEKLWKG